MQPIGRLVDVDEVAAAVHAVRRQRRDQRQGINVDGGAVQSMSLQRVNPASLADAARLLATPSSPTGDTVFLAGQTGAGRAARSSHGGVVAQFEQALANLLTALARPAARPADLASLTVYIVDMDDYRAHAREIGAVWRRLVGADYPAMAGIGVVAALGRRRAGRGAGVAVI